jgi:uncharacterized protein (UPF0548 family)
MRDGNETEWRFGRGWSENELEARADTLRALHLNFDSHEVGWRRYYSEAMIGLEEPGPPRRDGVFERAWRAVREYEFSDPGIVVAHFDRHAPLLGRDMLLEIQVLGLRYLCGTRVGAVREADAGSGSRGETVRGFRYDTLQGHLEKGSEWFMVTKREDGQIWFRIHASWRPGQFPNWWSHLGFNLLARRYQLAWHRLAYLRLREIVGSRGQRLKPLPQGERLFHSGPEISDSDLWVLNQPTAARRVRALGKQDAALIDGVRPEARQRTQPQPGRVS